MNDEQIHKRVPARRFPEFKNDGEWEKNIFSDVLFFLPNNTLSRADLNYDKGVVKNIHYGDVLIKFGETLDVKECSLPFISDEKKAQKACQGVLKNGDVVIADTAEDEVVGKCTELKNVSNEIVVSGLHTIPVRPNVSFVSSFLGFYLNSESYRNQLKPLMQGVKVVAISKGALSTTKIAYPRNSEEQKKIADCLSSMNDLISVTKNKLELLKKQKNGLMQKLFPDNGKTAPEIRFKEFDKNGEWIIKRLDRIATAFSGGTPTVSKKDYYNNGDIPFIRSGEINSSQTELFLTREGLENSSAQMVEKGSILYALYGATSGEVAIAKIKGAINQAVLAIVPYNGYNAEYIFQYLKSQRNFINSRYLQGGQGNLSGSIINALPIPIPSLEEQVRIADIFACLDKMILQFSNKIVFLEKQKKGLMRQLFPLS